jgi:hypothetical protein
MVRTLTGVGTGFSARQRRARMVRTLTGVGTGFSVRQRQVRMVRTLTGVGTGFSVRQRQARMVRTLEIAGGGQGVLPAPIPGRSARSHAQRADFEAAERGWIGSVLRLGCPPCAPDIETGRGDRPTGAATGRQARRPADGRGSGLRARKWPGRGLLLGGAVLALDLLRLLGLLGLLVHCGRSSETDRRSPRSWG